MKDVAAAARVSTATVSNAFNGTGRVSDPVRARVFAVSAELGYAGPDPAGRSLRSGRAGAIGVLFTTDLRYAFGDPHCSAMLAGVAEIAQPTRTGMWLMPLDPAGAADPARHRDAMEVVRRAVVDGVLADGIPDSHPALDVLATRGLPVVRTIDDGISRCVVLNDMAAAREVGEHLAGLGHRHVAVLLDAQTRRTTAVLPHARARLAGLRAGVGDRATVTEVAAGANTHESGRTAAARLLDRARPPSAIAAVTDVLALGALDLIRQRGLRPGVDVSVTGFDDIPAASDALLTTVRQPIEEKGRVMARMLLEPRFDVRRVELATELVVRASTGRAGGRSSRGDR